LATEQQAFDCFKVLSYAGTSPLSVKKFLCFRLQPEKTMDEAKKFFFIIYFYIMTCHVNYPTTHRKQTVMLNSTHKNLSSYCNISD